MTLIKSKRSELLSPISTMFDDLMEGDFFDRFATDTKIPAVNVSENDDHYKVEMAAPGLKKEDFVIDLNQNMLTISAEKKEEKEEKDDEKVTRREYNFSSFSRRFSLPENVKAEGIEAEYKDGLLNIKLPKSGITNAEPTRKITVN